MPSRALPRLALILSLALAPAGPDADGLAAQQPGAAPDTAAWDFYALGIHLGELTAGPDAYTIRRKDPAANAWLPARTVEVADVAADSAFLLQGAIARLPARLASLQAAGWAESRPAVAWPDAETIYEPGDIEAAVVDGRPTAARRWVARDASDPMDVVVDLEGRVVAAVDVNSDLVLVRRGWEDATTVGRWRRAKVSPAEHGYRALGKQMVPVRDGTRLATLVYLPDGPQAEGPFPVVFIRTPYGIGGLIGNFWHYAARGYAVVLQAVRGTAYWDPEHRSEGEWGWFRNEAADGADALAWVASQPWSNGEVCTQGGSYLGYTQWNQTMAADPALKCTIPEVSMGTMFSDQPYWGGGFVEGIAYYITWMLDRQPIRDGLTWTEVLHHRPLVDIDEFAVGEDIPQWNALLENWINGAYWAPQNWYAAEVSPELSTFQISGWWDDDFAGTMANWAFMRERSDAPQRLLIGPWKHGYNADRALNGFSFGPSAVREDVWLLKQLWYDRHLKGMDNGVTDRVVDYFVLGDDAWRTALDWPPPEAEPTPFYLRSDGDAEGAMTSGRLTRSAPTAPEPYDEWVYDPAHPVTNWMSFDRMTRWEDQQTWPYDFKDVEGRPDVGTYTSEPLAQDLTIAGDLMLVLHASTDVKDTDWWVHVSDVDPDGLSKRISTGVLRARFRNRDDPQYGALGENYTEEELLSGDIGDVVEYRIGLRSIANTFKAGHRIRVAVYNALDNYEFPNSNTGADEATVTTTVPGTMRVHHAPGRASHILLPVMPSVPAPAADHHTHLTGPSGAQALVRVKQAVGEPVAPGDSTPVTADSLLAALDAAGIRRAGAVSAAYFYGMPEMGGPPDELERVREENDWVAAQVAGHTDRLTGFCSVNPVRDYAVAEVRRCGGLAGIGGIKLHFANSGLDLRDADQLARMRAVFAAANEAGLGILVHMRTRESAYGAEDVRGFVREVLPAAADVPVVIAHMAGWGGYDAATDAALSEFARAIEAGEVDDDVVFELAAVVLPTLEEGANMLQADRQLPDARARLAALIRRIGTDRVVFGTDWPAFDHEPYVNRLWYGLPLEKAEIADILDNVSPVLR